MYRGVGGGAGCGNGTGGVGTGGGAGIRGKGGGGGLATACVHLSCASLYFFASSNICYSCASRFLAASAIFIPARIGPAFCLTASRVLDMAAILVPYCLINFMNC